MWCSKVIESQYRSKSGTFLIICKALVNTHDMQSHLIWFKDFISFSGDQGTLEIDRGL